MLESRSAFFASCPTLSRRSTQPRTNKTRPDPFGSASGWSVIACATKPLGRSLCPFSRHVSCATYENFLDTVGSAPLVTIKVPTVGLRPDAYFPGHSPLCVTYLPGQSVTYLPGSYPHTRPLVTHRHCDWPQRLCDAVTSMSRSTQVRPEEHAGK